MKIKHYKNGLTLIVETNASLRSVTAGIMVATGSVYETPENNGISHFIEHMQFKGTERRSARQIVGEFDRAGAVYNAFTGKEYTCFYFKSIDERVEACFDVLSDLFLNSVFAKDELDRERKVILEEINMSKDEPDGVCYDVLCKTAFGSGSLGMEILGTKENVSRFDRADILAYKAKNYIPAKTVVAFVGNITEAYACELVDKYMSSLAESPYVQPAALELQPFTSGYGEYVHDFEQSEISIAYPALTLGDDRAQTLSALDCIVGNGMSSRLFQSLREKLGLVYSVYSQPWFGVKNGMFTVSANVNLVNLDKAIPAIRAEIDAITRDGVTEEEIEKAKTQLKSAAVFGKENPMSYMLALMRRRALLGIDYDLDDLLKKFDAVTAADVNGLAREIFSKNPAIAYAGKKPPVAIDALYNN